MDINASYQKIIAQLKEEKRPCVQLGPKDIEIILQEWEKAFPSGEKLKPLLAILGHSQKECPQFEPIILKALQDLEDKETLIFLLSAFQKHIIESYQKRGLRFTQKILKSLEKVLLHPDPHVLEWALRTVEQLGPQKLFFKAIVMKRKPSLLKSFFPQQRVIRELIKMILEGGVKRSW